jgi:hypothetical protein
MGRKYRNQAYLDTIWLDGNEAIPNVSSTPHRHYPSMNPALEWRKTKNSRLLVRHGDVV